MSRTNARECAMKLLYEYSIHDELNEAFLDEEYEGFYSQPLEKDDIKFVKKALQGFIQKQEEIDAIISANSHSWRFERISKVDLAILRLAIYELIDMDTPKKVVVNEAVELAKKYSADKSYKYINGLLGGYLKTVDK